MSSWGYLNTRPYSPTENFDYRIGRNVAGLLRLRDIGVPFPDTVIFVPYATSYIRADLSMVGDGASRVEWVWDVLSIAEIKRLNDIFFTSDTQTYADLRYIRTDLRYGNTANPNTGFANYTVTVYRPNLSGESGNPIVRSAFALQNVKYIFTNLATP